MQKNIIKDPINLLIKKQISWFIKREITNKNVD